MNEKRLMVLGIGTDPDNDYYYPKTETEIIETGESN